MADRRTLREGLAATPRVDPQVARDFAYEGKDGVAPHSVPKSPPHSPPVVAAARAPISTRIRDDMAKALKRASLERQLQGVEPSRLQDILEEALEPWLKANGYLS